MKKLRFFWLIIAFSLVAAALLPRSRNSPEPVTATENSPSPNTLAFACQGRIEGGSDPIEVSSPVDGVIQSVLVNEGQAVLKGQTIARMSCQDSEANTRSQQAMVESAKQALLRLHRGSREEERLAASEATAAARAVQGHARATFDRLAGLFKTEDVSRQAYENAQRDLEVAEASLHKAEQQERLVYAPPVEEDVARLEAELAAAKARALSAEAAFGKCAVVSPVNGTVVKILRHGGESVSTFTPQPILIVGDLTTRRVRAEVDERDVAKVSVGQPVTVRVEGGFNQPGRVARMALRMGRKNIQSIMPGDKNERDILDVWIDVPGGCRNLPLGLRVTVQFLYLGEAQSPLREKAAQ